MGLCILGLGIELLLGVGLGLVQGVHLGLGLVFVAWARYRTWSNILIWWFWHCFISSVYNLQSTDQSTVNTPVQLGFVQKLCDTTQTGGWLLMVQNWIFAQSRSYFPEQVWRSQELIPVYSWLLNIVRFVTQTTSTLSPIIVITRTDGYAVLVAC